MSYARQNELPNKIQPFKAGTSSYVICLETFSCDSGIKKAFNLILVLDSVCIFIYFCYICV